jgi:hypothetical protein
VPGEISCVFWCRLLARAGDSNRFFLWPRPIKRADAWGVGGRAGYLVGPSLLAYWTGGFTQARFDQVNYSDAQSGAATGLVLPAQTYDGWYLGGGIEFELGGYVPGLYWNGSRTTRAGMCRSYVEAVSVVQRGRSIRSTTRVRKSSQSGLHSFIGSTGPARDTKSRNA